MKPDDLTGRRFGNLTVIAKAGLNKRSKVLWACVCDCGRIKKKPVIGYDLKSGKVTSCGCKYKTSNKERNKTHGKTHTRIYNIWQSMKQRCYNKKTIEFFNYGGRGISVCKEWENDFKAFYDWAVKNGYSDTLTLDRIDSNGDYEPSNCRWTTMKKQQNNRRNNRIIEINGTKRTLSEWAEHTGISAATIAWRINHGWSKSELLIEPNYANKARRDHR